MGWTITDDLDRFEAEAGGFLARYPVENSVPRTVCGTIRRRGPQVYGAEPPYFGWWRPDGGGAVAAAFLRTPPYPPLLTRGTPEAARALATELPPPLDGVRGGSEAVRAFTEVWRERTAATVTVEREMRSYRLGTLTPPLPAPPGRARVAEPGDRELLLRWHEEFGRDIGEPLPGRERMVDDALTYGGRTLWEVDGTPVTMAGSTAPADGAIRIVSVYTPRELRGRGYAGAVTTAVSQAALDAGAATVLLSADLANPVSNRLYRRLGFTAVRDQMTVAFT
ncbi:GNAT family N-acetyltransferase [Streptomyces sp. NBC_01476]|uniref:GNAT family N-acetyltransferase n=1 Tax=Streptomyces sp. NBC_01476 TaxID=2903881 RepID=UPI002E2F0417|nr:GNAT family N-acetyltransferase [Streptomyces sp. NBC_01476]